MNNPVIVVIAYNRTVTLNRLLFSLKNADYNNTVDLIISIDKSNTDDIIQIAKNFSWIYGNKIIIKQDTRLGLKKHVLACGDLTKEYSAVIVLEDDLVVAPSFYKFSQLMIDKYSNDEKISAISLYGFPINEFVNRPFYPLNYGDFVYFLQSASSWGQIWTTNQWKKFRNWLENKESLGLNSYNIPEKIKKWADNSWKKWFNAYLVDTDTYSVVPYNSFTTNCGDAGEHFKDASNIFNIPLNINFLSKLVLPEINNNSIIYDAFFELKTDIITKLLGNKFKFIDENNKIESDFYGLKNRISDSKVKYILTSKSVSQSIKTFGDKINPAILNVLYDLEGEQYSLSLIENIIWEKESNFIKKQIYDDLLSYTSKDMLSFLLYKYFKKIIKFLKG